MCFNGKSKRSGRWILLGVVCRNTQNFIAEDVALPPEQTGVILELKPLCPDVFRSEGKGSRRLNPPGVVESEYAKFHCGRRSVTTRAGGSDPRVEASGPCCVLMG